MQLFADISSAKVVVIGAGEMGELLVQHLFQIGCKNITIVNRSYERGLNIAKRYGVVVRKWEELAEQLIGANIAIGNLKPCSPMILTGIQIKCRHSISI